MKKWTIAGAAILPALCITFASAGEKDPQYETIVQEMLRLIDTMTKQLQTVKKADKNSVDTARPGVMKAAKEFVAVLEKAKKAKPPSAEKKAKLEKEFREKMVKAQKSFFAEMARIRSFDAGKQLSDEIADLLNPKKKKSKIDAKK